MEPTPEVSHDIEKAGATIKRLCEDVKQLRKTNSTPYYARKILATHSIKSDIDSGDIYLYHPELGYYDSYQANHDIGCLIKEQLLDKFTINRKNEIIAFIKLETGCNVRDFDGRYICLNNGVFNLDTFQLDEHSPEKFVSFRLNVDYQPKIDMEPWTDYVKTVFGRYEQKIQEAMGNIFERGYVTKKAIYIVGNTNSGKSTFCVIVLSLFNKRDYTSFGLADLDNNPYALADFNNKKLNLCSEMDYKMKFSGITILNKLAGNDWISTRRIYSSPFQFVNTAKLFFSGNGVPYVNDANQAFYNRWEFIDCNNTFSPDDTIFGKYTTPEMKSRILNWMIDGYKRLKENKWIFTMATNNEEVMSRFNNAESSQDTFLIWIQSRCEKSDGYETVADLFRACRDWHQANGLLTYPDNVQHFGTAILNQRIVPVTEYRPRKNGKQVHAYKGIRMVKK